MFHFAKTDGELERSQRGQSSSGARHPQASDQGSSNVKQVTVKAFCPF